MCPGFGASATRPQSAAQIQYRRLGTNRRPPSSGKWPMGRTAVVATATGTSIAIIKTMPGRANVPRWRGPVAIFVEHGKHPSFDVRRAGHADRKGRRPPAAKRVCESRADLPAYSRARCRHRAPDRRRRAPAQHAGAAQSTRPVDVSNNTRTRQPPAFASGNPTGRRAPARGSNTARRRWRPAYRRRQESRSWVARIPNVIGMVSSGLRSNRHVRRIPISPHTLPEGAAHSGSCTAGARPASR